MHFSPRSARRIYILLHQEKLVSGLICYGLIMNTLCFILLTPYAFLLTFFLPKFPAPHGFPFLCYRFLILFQSSQFLEFPVKYVLISQYSQFSVFSVPYVSQFPVFPVAYVFSRGFTCTQFSVFLCRHP